MSLAPIAILITCTLSQLSFHCKNVTIFDGSNHKKVSIYPIYAAACEGCGCNVMAATYVVPIKFKQQYPGIASFKELQTYFIVDAGVADYVAPHFLTIDISNQFASKSNIIRSYFDAILENNTSLFPDELLDYQPGIKIAVNSSNQIITEVTWSEDNYFSNDLSGDTLQLIVYYVNGHNATYYRWCNKENGIGGGILSGDAKSGGCSDASDEQNDLVYIFTNTTTNEPTMDPTIDPTNDPTTDPTNDPTIDPTIDPTLNPTNDPTEIPTIIPTKYPTDTPTNIPTSNPTNIITIYRYDDGGGNDNIVITNHPNISNNWIAFSISNVNTSCGGDDIHSVAISDSFSYRNQRIYPNYTINDSHRDYMINNKTMNTSNKYYVFSNFQYPFQVPIQVHLEKLWFGEYATTILSGNETDKYYVYITSTNVITALEGWKQFDFESNFCEIDTSAISDKTEPDQIDWTFYYFVIVIVCIFFVIGTISLLDAKCFCRRNDYFNCMALITSLLQILDMLSDVFFIINVSSKLYKNENENKNENIQFLLIFVLSIIFVLIPIIISLFQLHYFSSKYWLKNNRTTEWLKSYNKLLYFVSVFTGSSFTSIEIFNSNMFGLDIFCMGLSKQFILNFSTKKVYSIILFENCPQLILSAWYTVIIGELDYIPATQMVFSLISIIVTIISLMLQNKIYKTQNYIYITIDIKGKCVMDKIKIAQNRINSIKTYLSQTILVINEKSMDIQKPFTGVISNGLRLQINITYIHDISYTNIDPTKQYKKQLNDAIRDDSFQQIIKNEWKLSNVPQIGNIQCELRKKQNCDIIDDSDQSDDEQLQLKASQITDQWTNVTKQTSIDSQQIELYS